VISDNEWSSLLISLDDAVFGRSQELLGLVLAAVVFCVTSMSAPFDNLAKGAYSETMSQFMPIFGIMLIAFLFHNAAKSVYY
jgi:predicted transporter